MTYASMHTCRALAFAERDKGSVYSIFLPRYPSSSSGVTAARQVPREPASQALSLFPLQPLDAQRPPQQSSLVPPPSTENLSDQNYPLSQPSPSRACIPAVGRSQPGIGLWISRLLGMGGIFSALHLCILII